MANPAQIEIVLRAYRLWQQAGEPIGRDDKSYHQAEQELRTKAYGSHAHLLSVGNGSRAVEMVRMGMADPARYRFFGEVMHKVKAPGVSRDELQRAVGC